MQCTSKVKAWLVLGVIVVCALVGCQTAVIREQSQGTLYTFKSDGHGFDTKNYFYDTGKEVVVFDAQFTAAYAQQSIDFIRTKTKSPITHVVVTHPNPDKFNGITVFQKLGAKVIASKKTAAAMAGVHAYKKYYFVKVAKSFTDATYPTLGTVDVTFEKEYKLSLGTGEVLRLTELGTAGVSSNQTVAYIPSIKSYIVGDLVHHKAHAWLEGGIVNGKPVPTLKQWRATLDALLALEGANESLVYGGRGEKAPLGQAVQAQKTYLRKAESIVKEYVGGLQDKSVLQGEKAAAHYKALQTQFEAAFPDYALGYMIQYGVYGLVGAYQD